MMSCNHCYEFIGTLEELLRLKRENADLRMEINGMRRVCVHAEKSQIGCGSFVTCEYLRKRNILAQNGKRYCDHWKWRGDTDAITR